MAQEPNLAEKDPEVIRQHIEETRSSLTEKLETLEQEVKETVVGAKEAVTGTVEAVKETVENTVESVKETVSDTVDTVKRTFDLRYQTEQHPWGMVGGSFAAGLLTGYLLPTPTPRVAHQAWGWTRDRAAELMPSSSGDGSSYRPVESAVSGPSAQQEQPSGPGLLSTLAEKFEPELNTLKGLAVGAALGLLRDFMTRSMQDQMAGQVRNVIDSITTKLGGKPMEGSVLDHFAESFGVRPNDRPAGARY